MDHRSSTHDSEPNSAAQEFLRDAYSHADTIYAVPQPAAWDIQVDGQSRPKRFVKYQYRPLAHEHEVRLIRLHHASASTARFRGDVLPQCEIFHADLRNKPQYETISYAWGSLHLTEAIFIGNDCCLAITRNLWEALNVLRLLKKPLVLWADQIGIDQHNLSERQRQVALMQKIYSQARKTIVWLGQTDDTAALAFDFVEKVSKLELERRVVWQIGVDTVRYGEDAALAQHKHLKVFINRERQGLRALSKLLRRPWFSRMWCFQEVVVSRNLLYLCGPSGCMWEDLYKAAGLCYEEPLPPVGWSSTNGALESRERHLLGQSDELLDLLQRTSYCLCTDPRDKIYAVLNVQSRYNPVELAADYTRTIRDVYIDTTRQIISKTRSLAIFILRRENVKSDIPNLPSWVPDFAAAGAAFPVEHNARPSFHAPAYRPYIAHGPEILGQLYARGRVVDRVTGVIFESLYTSLHDEAFAVDRLYPTMLEILRGHMGAGGMQATGIDPVAEKLIRTLTADLGGLWDRKEQSTVDDVGIGLVIEALEAQPSNHGILNPWLQHFRSEARRCTSRSWLSLEEHTLALGPKSAHPGDSIVILNGSAVPCIIRSKGHYFELVGQCYVDGMMYGELCVWPDEEADTFFLV